MSKTSFFSQGQVCSSWKKFPAYILDFITALIFNIILFAVAEGIMNATPLVKWYRNSINKKYSQLVDTVVSTSVSKKNDNGDLVDQTVLVDDYIHGSVLYVLKENVDDNEISKETYKDYKVIDSTNDYAYLYYVSFKAENISSYESNDDKYGLSYYKSEFFKNTKEEYFTSSDYPYLTLDTAKAIDNYFRDSNYKKGKDAFESITSSYSLIIDSANADIQNSYIPYKNLLIDYNAVSKKMFIVRNVELSITYLLSVLLVYLMFPLIFKDGRTLSMKILKIGKVNTKDECLSYHNHLRNVLITLVEMILIIPITAFIFYGVDAVELVGESMFLNISYLSLGIFSIVFICLSFLLSFMLRKTRQTVTEYLSGEVVKDSDVFYVSTEVNDTDESK